MIVEGTIKSMRAANSVGMADVSQIVQFEIYGDHAWMELRDLMQKPLKIELTAKQMKFGEKDHGAVEASIVAGSPRKRGMIKT